MKTPRQTFHCILVFALGVGFQAAATGAPLTIDQYISLLNQAVLTGQAEATAERLITEVDPDDPIAQYNLGTALRSKKLHPQAIRVLTRATKLAPGNALAHASLGFASFWAERCDIATPAFSAALALDANNKVAWLWNTSAGGCYIHTQDFEAAIRVCERALVLKPNNPRGELCLAKAQLGAKRYELALAGFLRVNKTTTEPPYAGQAQKGVLISLAKLQRLSEAIDLLKFDKGQYSSPAALEHAAAFAKKSVEELSPRGWWQL